MDKSESKMFGHGNNRILEGKVAVITGASKGLGKGFALALAQAGANISVVCRHKDSLADVVSEAAASGAGALALEADIACEEDVRECMKATADRFGGIDILVNNAATGRNNKPPEDTSLEEWNSVINTNINGMFLCAREAGKTMKPQGRGKIINLSSISGLIVNKYFHGGSYDVSKAAVTHLTKVLAVEWAPYNITVNALAPGYYETEPNMNFFDSNRELRDKVLEMIPLKRFGNVEELANLLVYLCSGATNYMTGSVIQIDGGYTLW